MVIKELEKELIILLEKKFQIENFIRSTSAYLNAERNKATFKKENKIKKSKIEIPIFDQIKALAPADREIILSQLKAYSLITKEENYDHKPNATSCL